jgi:nifR3 family TIM-barrel protein
MPNFWKQLNKPIFALAPMEDVTDAAFREMFAKYGKPSVMYTEFVNVDGLTHPEGYKKLSLALKFTEAQRPMVAQIWGTNPEKFYQAAQIIVKLGFDGIDINMGCPQDKEIGLGSCAALIRNPELAGQIIAATKKGAGDLPVSVKTRLGYSKTDEMETWVKFLLQQDIAALALHARTKQEKSKVPAHWEKIGEAVKVRDKMQETRDKQDKTLIIGNGDVKSRTEGLQYIAETACDGVMVGRGAFGNPWLFREDNHEPTIKERLSVMLEHAQLFNQILGGQKPFVIMRKHFKAYCSGFPGAAELRAKLMETKSLEEAKEIVNNFLGDIVEIA